MKFGLERSMKVLAVAVTIAFSSVFAASVVNAAPNLQETPADEPAPVDAVDFGVLVLNGTVTIIDSDTLTIVDANNESFVANLDEFAVIFDVATQSEVSLADVTEGDLIEVVGIENVDGDINADFVSILPEGESIRGKVAEVLGTTIIISNEAIDYAITTNDETVFFVDDEAASLSAIAVDMNVQAYGEFTDQGALSANLIVAHQGITSSPIEADVSDLGRQRDTVDEALSEPAMPPGGYSVDRQRDVEPEAAAAVPPPGGYSVGRQRDP